MGSVQGNQSLGMSTGLSNAHSEPATPATTPPGSTVPTMQPYQTAPSYDHGRPMYSAAPSQQGQYASQPTVTQQNMARFGQPMQPSQYVKNEMGPPSSRAPGADDHHGEAKPADHLLSHSQGNGPAGHGAGEEEADHEHEPDFAHDNNAAYNANRGPAYYSGAPAVGGLSGEHPHLSPELTGSPHHSGSGRATPRTAAAPTSSWGAVQSNSGYNTPPRAQPAGSSLYNVMGGSDSRGPTTNGVSSDTYPTSNGLSGYAAQPIVNGSSSNKRLRDVDDDGDRGSRPGSRGTLDDIESLKRRKTFREGSLPGGAIGGSIGSNFDAGRQPIAQRRR
jgi:protein SOK2